MSEKNIDHGDGCYPPDDYTGEWEVYWPNGQLKFKATLIAGEEEGEAICYWEDGQMAQRRFTSDGKPVGLWEDWQPDFKLYEINYDMDPPEKTWFPEDPDALKIEYLDK